MELEQVSTHERFLSDFDDLLSTGTNEIILGCPPEHISKVRDGLRTIYQEREAFVMLCVYTDPETASEIEYDDIATLVRAWDVPANTVMHVDQRRGILAPPSIVHNEESEAVAFTYDTQMLYNMGFPQFLSQQWDMGQEVYVSDARGLPYECGSLRDAAVNATLHLRQDNTVGFEADVRPAPAEPEDPWGDIEGRIVTTRQSFIHPATNTFFGETGLIGRNDDEGRVTMGGVGAYAEDYETQNVRLTPAD
jgi:hypothetical protein